MCSFSWSKKVKIKYTINMVLKFNKNNNNQNVQASPYHAVLQFNTKNRAKENFRLFNVHIIQDKLFIAAKQLTNWSTDNQENRQTDRNIEGKCAKKRQQKNFKNLTLKGKIF